MKKLSFKKFDLFYDQYLFIAITLLSILGLIFLFSASQGNTSMVFKQGLFVLFGILLMLFYMMKFKLGVFDDEVPDQSQWWFGVSPEGFGTLAMIVNFIVSIVICKFTEAPPKKVQDLVDDIRIPLGVKEAQGH